MDQPDINQLLRQNKDIVVIVAILLACLIASKKIYDGQNKKYKELKEKIQTEQEKGQSLDRIILVNEQIKKIRNRSWKEADFNAVVDEVSVLASESSVKVSNIMPLDKKDEPHYVLIPFQMSARATYKNTLKFLKKLETLTSLVHIKDVVFSPDRSERIEDPERQGGRPVESTLMLSLTAEAYYFK